MEHDPLESNLDIIRSLLRLRHTTPDWWDLPSFGTWRQWWRVHFRPHIYQRIAVQRILQAKGCMPL